MVQLLLPNYEEDPRDNFGRDGVSAEEIAIRYGYIDIATLIREWFE